MKNSKRKSKKSEREQANLECECGGKGYFEDKNEQGKIVKTMCLFCLEKENE